MAEEILFDEAVHKLEIAISRLKRNPLVVNSSYEEEIVEIADLCCDAKENIPSMDADKLKGMLEECRDFGLLKNSSQMQIELAIQNLIIMKKGE